jgi:hypothetical protein
MPQVVFLQNPATAKLVRFDLCVDGVYRVH